MRASGAAERIGSSGDLTNCTADQRERANRWYTRLLPTGTKDGGPASSRPEADHNADFLRNLTGMEAPFLPSLPPLPCRPGFRLPEQPYLLAAPGASWSGRQWPTEKFSEAIRSICLGKGWNGALCGKEADKERAHSVALGCGWSLDDRTGKTTLPELVELIRGAALLIGNESGPAHIAAAVGTPAVCVTGGGHFGRFVPYPPGWRTAPVPVFEPMECYHCNWRCTRPHSKGETVPCVSAVTVESVLKAAERAVDPGSPSTA